MQNDDWTKPSGAQAAAESDEEAVERHEAQEPAELIGDGTWLRRIAIFLGVLVVLGLMVVLPPLLNMSRYQRRVANSISASLGRPVHLDSVTLNVLPMPGFTLNNFTVSEDPEFGSEPVIRANTVRANLRMSSLWRGRVEFSKISLIDPSVNLVHLPDGRWNLESILLQASRMPVAPTEQKRSGGTQRFPYIEATGARVNLKLGSEKVPFALTEAEFALWLPEPEQWKLRLEAHPARTDTSVSDTGMLQVEGTLGRAASLAAVPIDLTAQWSAVPLGAVSLIAIGRDAGMRGDMTLTAAAHGTVGEHAAITQLKVTGLRRTDFVPARSLDLNIRCTATAINTLQSLHGVSCTWPPPDKNSITTGGLMLTGEVPDTQQFSSAFGKVTLKNVPASALLDGLRVASRHVNRDVTLDGTLDGSLMRPARKPMGAMTGTFTIKNTRLALGSKIFVKGDATARLDGLRAEFGPVTADFGGHDSASIGASADSGGVRVDLRGNVPPGLLRVFGIEPAQAAEGSSPADTVVVDEHVRRGWGADGSWTEDVPAKAKPKTSRRSRRRP